MDHQLFSFDNLLLAYRKASKGKRGSPNVASFEFKLEDNLLQLQRELIEKTYQPGKYHSFYIHDPKTRLISAAPFRDRVVHHALCNLIEPLFERSFIFDSYANRAGKGTHQALDRVTHYARRFRYVLTCDIRQFFPSIDHEILFNILDMSLRAHFAKQSPVKWENLIEESLPLKRGLLRRDPRRIIGAGEHPPCNDMDVLWLIQKILQSGIGVLSEEYEMVYFTQDDPSTPSAGQGLLQSNVRAVCRSECDVKVF